MTRKLFLTVGSAALLSVMPKADLAVAESSTRSEGVSALNTTVAGVTKKTTDDFLQDTGHVAALLEAASEYYDKYFKAPEGVEGVDKDSFSRKAVVNELVKQLNGKDENAISLNEKLLQNYRLFLLRNVNKLFSIEEATFKLHPQDEGLRKKLAALGTQELGEYNHIVNDLIKEILEANARNAEENKSLSEIVNEGIKCFNLLKPKSIRFTHDETFKKSEVFGGVEALAKKINNLDARIELLNLKASFESLVELKFLDKPYFKDELLSWFNVASGYPCPYSYISPVDQQELMAFAATLKKVDCAKDVKKLIESLINVCKPFENLKERLVKKTLEIKLEVSEGQKEIRHVSVEDVQNMVIHQDFKKAVEQAVSGFVNKGQDTYLNHGTVDFSAIQEAIQKAAQEEHDWDNDPKQMKDKLLGFMSHFNGVDAPQTPLDFFKYNVRAIWGEKIQSAIDDIDIFIDERNIQLTKGICNEKGEDKANELQAKHEKTLGLVMEEDTKLLSALENIETLGVYEEGLNAKEVKWTALEETDFEGVETYGALVNIKQQAHDALETIKANKVLTQKGATADELESFCEEVTNLKLFFDHLETLNEVAVILKDKILHEREALAHSSLSSPGGETLIEENSLFQQIVSQVLEAVIYHFDFKQPITLEEPGDPLYFGNAWYNIDDKEAFVDRLIEKAKEVRQKMGKWHAAFKTTDQTTQPLLGDSSFNGEMQEVKRKLQWVGPWGFQYHTNLEKSNNAESLKEEIRAGFRKYSDAEYWVVDNLIHGNWDDFIEGVDALREDMKAHKETCERIAREVGITQ